MNSNLDLKRKMFFYKTTGILAHFLIIHSKVTVNHSKLYKSSLMKLTRIFKTVKLWKTMLRDHATDISVQETRRTFKCLSLGPLPALIQASRIAGCHS